MSREQIVSTLERHAADLKQREARRLFLFGSAARDEMTPTSDVDLFFDYANAGFSLLDLMSLQERLSEILGARADATSRGSLHPALRDAIERAALQVL